MFIHTKGREILPLPHHSASRTNTLSDNLARELALCVFMQLTHTHTPLQYNPIFILLNLNEEQAAGKSTVIVAVTTHELEMCYII